MSYDILKCDNMLYKINVKYIRIHLYEYMFARNLPYQKDEIHKQHVNTAREKMVEIDFCDG